jgi:CRISPR-associated protein Cas2
MKRVISYDIMNDSRRNQIFKILKDYGRWVQYSLFEIDCDEKRWIELEHRLFALLDKEEDSLCIYHLCHSCQRKTCYKGESSEESVKESDYIL